MGWLDDAADALRVVLATVGLAAPPSPPIWQGYVEGEFIYVAPTIAGRLERLQVRRGDRVTADTPLFTLEQTAETAAREEAAARLAQAEARYTDLTKGKRPPEIEALEAQRSDADAQLRLALLQLERQRRLVGSPAAMPERLDEARAIADQRRAKVRELEAQLTTARMAARDDELRAAAADAAAARSALAQATWRLDQRTVAAPIGGIVFDTYHWPGEMVPAGQPVASILPPERLRARFYVAQADLAKFPVGAAVKLSCDGCGGRIDASVTFVAPEAEFTPPVLYNRENRGKMVFLLEARPIEPTLALRPGQPIDVLKP